MTSLFARDFSIRSIAILRDHLLHSNSERSYMTLRLSEIAIYNFFTCNVCDDRVFTCNVCDDQVFTCKVCDDQVLHT